VVKTGAKKRLVILDTHAILHRAYHALPDFSSSKGVPTGALYGLLTMVLRIATELGPDHIVAAFDLPGPTFRDAVYAKYKATRSETDGALIEQIKRAREVLGALGLPLYDAESFEADDVIGTLVEQAKKDKNIEVIIASGDMDTLQLVEGERVKVFTLKKGLSDTVLYDERKVMERYGFGPQSIPDYKGLRGDPSDNIPGVKGVGEKTASILIAEFGTIEEMYKALKKDPEKLLALGVKQGMIDKLDEQKEEAQFSKMLAEIRRDAPVKLVLPKKTWRETADGGKVLDMLNEFEFRSLVPRVKQILGGGDGAAPKKVLGSPVQPEAAGQSGQTIFSDSPAPPPADAERAKLAVWVLDSNLTEPTLEDVSRLGKSSDFDEAFANLKKQIKERELDFVYNEIELPLSPVLRRMETRGITIDKKFLGTLSKDYHKEADTIAKRIYKAAGVEFNIGSPKQLGEILFDKLGLASKNQKKTAGGARSTRESELLKLKSLHPIIEDILAYREVQKLLSTYIDPIPTLLDSENRLHTTYIQTGSATGRVASQNPNLQNIPIKTELGRAIRHGFVASAGMKLVSFDYSQVELRIAAFLSGDEALAEIFRNGRDVHTEVASRVFHVKDSEVTAEMRRRAKVINFGILYGMGVTSLQQALGTKRAEAQEFYNQYFEAFPRLSAYMDETIGTAAKKGYTQTYFGRRRYFDGIKSPIPYVKAAAERMALNAPFQGTAADLFKLATIKVDAYLQESKVGHLLLQVHDELVFEVYDDKVKEAAPTLRALMEGVVSEKERNGIPFLVEGKVGDDWGEMQKI
jgi:DNA polymerase-1